MDTQINVDKIKESRAQDDEETIKKIKFLNKFSTLINNLKNYTKKRFLAGRELDRVIDLFLQLITRRRT